MIVVRVTVTWPERRRFERVRAARAQFLRTRRTGAQRPDGNADRVDRGGVAVRAPDDDAGQARDVRFARDQIADAAFVEPADVVDDQHAPGRGLGDRFEEHVGAAGVPRRTRRAGDA